MANKPDSKDTRFTPVESEMYTLGCMIQSRDALAEVMGTGITEGMFYRPLHASMFRAIAALDDRGEEIEPLTVADEIEKTDGTKWGQTALLVFEMVSKAAVTANALTHARRVMDGYQRRLVASTATQLSQYAADPSTEVPEMVERSLGALESLSDGPSDNQPETFGELINTTAEYFQRDAGRITWSGFGELDTVSGGFRPGQMIIVAARPGVGKSTFSLDVARYAAKQKRDVIYFTMEMAKPELVARALCAECSIDLGRLTHSNLTEEEAARLNGMSDTVARMPLWIDDAPGLTMSELKAKCRRVARDGDLGLVVVDYIGLITATQKYESRQVEIAHYSRSLKMLAKELDVPILVVVQLGRAAELNGEPRLHHLRESGALEQDADKVILLSNTDQDELKVDLVKNRSGELSEVLLTPMLHHCHFADRKWNPLAYI